jgi:hypothetical protein
MPFNEHECFNCGRLLIQKATYYLAWSWYDREDGELTDHNMTRCAALTARDVGAVLVGLHAELDREAT